MSGLDKGDGYADYIVLFDGGAADVYINTKNMGKDSNAPKFEDPVTLTKGFGIPEIK